MKFKSVLRVTLPALLALFASTLSAAPENFSQAKRLLREHVYHDQNASRGTFYCACQFNWVGRSGGRLDPSACGLTVTKLEERAQRIEWEHVVPASTAGRHLACWRNGGRENCQKTDPAFNRLEADMFNLVPAVGSVNAMRSDINYGMVAGRYENLGNCSTKIGTQNRVVEPRDEVKGMAARTTFYMADRYNIRLSRQQEAVLIAWDRQFPVTPWELERNRRISRAMGHSNEFVTGERRWTQGYRPSGEGLSHNPGRSSPLPSARPQMPAQVASAEVVIGNRRSGVYHLPTGCPSYNQVGQNNRVPFPSESAAVAAGFRKAGNCQ